MPHWILKSEHRGIRRQHLLLCDPQRNRVKYMELLKTASAFGLHSFGKPAPDGGAFEQFSTTAIALFSEHGIVPSYVGIEGEGYSGDYKKYGGAAHKKLMKSDFDRITVLSIVANPEGSDEPSYDGFATVSFSFVESTQEALLCFVVNESIIPFASDAYDDAWNAFLDLNAWDFGYGFRGEAEKQPDFHILGLDSGNLTEAENAALNAWYGTLPDERLNRLRDIYEYNFVSRHQLYNNVIDGVTLLQFIEQNQFGGMRQLTEHGLHLWKLDESQVCQIRRQLEDSECLISRKR